jgi:hypothetical protein
MSVCISIIIIMVEIIYMIYDCYTSVMLDINMSNI